MDTENIQKDLFLKLKKTHNFILGPCDTDSISLCKNDYSSFTQEEQNSLIEEINSLLPEYIQYAHDGYFDTVVIVKAKNYVLRTLDGKVKIKGSALKATMKENALKEFINKVIYCFLEGKQDTIVNIYNEYVKEILNLQDITRWTSKKNITSKVMDPQRTNEQKILDAIEDSEYVEGDKCFVFFDVEDKLVLQEHWNNNHNVVKLLKKLYDTVCIFKLILDIKQFTNYSLKRQFEKSKML